MLKRRDLGRIISERFTLRAGKPIPIYLGDWMVDYVFEARHMKRDCLMAMWLRYHIERSLTYSLRKTF